MNKKTRQYMGLLCAMLAYYLIHEGAHLLYALCTGTFRQIHLLGLGVQIDVHREQMTDVQLALFCLTGPAATILTAWILTILTGKLAGVKSSVLRACMYYITIAMMFADPAYLVGIYKLVGGGDMNGISLLLPEQMVQILGGVVLIVHAVVFWKWILPKYKVSFRGRESV